MQHWHTLKTSSVVACRKVGLEGRIRVRVRYVVHMVAGVEMPWSILAVWLIFTFLCRNWLRKYLSSLVRVSYWPLSNFSSGYSLVETMKLLKSKAHRQHSHLLIVKHHKRDTVYEHEWRPIPHTVKWAFLAFSSSRHRCVETASVHAFILLARIRKYWRDQARYIVLLCSDQTDLVWLARA